MYPFSFENVSFFPFVPPVPTCPIKTGKFENALQSGRQLRVDMGQYYRLQKTESGCIVPSQKNSGNLEEVLYWQTIANSSSISCFKIMNKAAMPTEPDNNETNRA